VCHDTNDAPPKPKTIYFPVAENFQKYEKDKHKKMYGASHVTINSIDAIRPYKGGNDLIWSLHSLNNIDKHRLLLTVGSVAAGVELFSTIYHAIKNVFPQETLTAFKSMELYLNPSNKGFPLTKWFVLYIGALDEKPDPNMKFRFDVAINELGVTEEVSLLELLRKFVIEVEKIFEKLKPLLK
jgi:hypothetical protein